MAKSKKKVAPKKRVRKDPFGYDADVQAPIHQQRVTRARARDAGACYSRTKLVKIIPYHGLEPHEVALLDITNGDKVWALIHATGPAGPAWRELWGRIADALRDAGFSRTGDMATALVVDLAACGVDPDYRNKFGLPCGTAQRRERTTPVWGRT